MEAAGNGPTSEMINPSSSVVCGSRKAELHLICTKLERQK